MEKRVGLSWKLFFLSLVFFEGERQKEKGKCFASKMDRISDILSIDSRKRMGKKGMWSQIRLFFATVTLIHRSYGW